MKRTIALFGLVLATVLGSAGVAHAQYGGPSTTDPNATPEVVAVRGQVVEMTGDGCAPGATVTLTWDDGSVLVEGPADADGTFSLSFTVPADASFAEHVVTATCASVEGATDHRQYLTVRVVRAGVAGSGADRGALPRTGASDRTGTLLGIGAGAVVLGVAFVVGARRQRRSASLAA